VASYSSEGGSAGASYSGYSVPPAPPSPPAQPSPPASSTAGYVQLLDTNSEREGDAFGVRAVDATEKPTGAGVEGAARSWQESLGDGARKVAKLTRSAGDGAEKLKAKLDSAGFSKLGACAGFVGGGLSKLGGEGLGDSIKAIAGEAAGEAVNDAFGIEDDEVHSSRRFAYRPDPLVSAPTT